MSNDFATAAVKRHGPEGKWGQIAATPDDRIILAVWLRGSREFNRGNLTDATTIRMIELKARLGEAAVKRVSEHASFLTFASEWRRRRKRSVRLNEFYRKLLGEAG